MFLKNLGAPKPGGKQFFRIFTLRSDGKTLII